MRLTDLKTDPPARMPNTSQGNNTWLINAKITLTPVEDLLVLPSQQDANLVNGLMSDLNALIAWRNAYARSAFARTYGAFDVTPPAATAPQMLVVQQPKDRALAPIYGKVAAEWQVDHWQFENMDLQLPKTGEPRSSFTGGPTMVQGTPEAEAFLAAERKAITDAKQRQAVIEAGYAKDLFAATKPGTSYRGQVSHARGVLPCEVRFLETPGADPQVAMFEVRLPQEPAYLFVYTAKLSPEVPLNIPSDDASSQSFRIPAGSTDADVPVGNLTVNFVRGTGKSNTFGSFLPSVMAGGVSYLRDKPFLLLDGRLKGVVASWNGDFSLAAEATR